MSTKCIFTAQVANTFLSDLPDTVRLQSTSSQISETFKYCAIARASPYAFMASLYGHTKQK
jgi:hypothetical protein